MKLTDRFQRASVILVAAVLTATVTILAAQSYSAPDQEVQTLTPELAWQRLQAGNKRFAEDRLKNPDLGATRRLELAKGQKPFAVVLTCADSRLTPEFIFNQGLATFLSYALRGTLRNRSFWGPSSTPWNICTCR